MAEMETEISTIETKLKRIDLEFSELVEKISKNIPVDSEAKVTPIYNPQTMKWEMNEVEEEMDWGDFEDIKEELKIEHDAFIVPVLDYCRIESK